MGQPAVGDPRAAPGRQPGAPAGYPPPAPPQQHAGYYPPAGAWGHPPPPGSHPPPPGAYGPPPGAYVPQGMHPPPHHLPPRQQHAYAKPPGFDAYDAEAAQAAAYAGAFAEAAVRKGFVRKVFLLVLLQLAVTVGVACVFMFVQPVKDYVRPGGSGQWVFIVAWILTLAVLIGLMCSTTLRRKHPWNLVALFALTIVMSVLVGCCTSYWDVEVVLVAFAVTCAAVAGLALVAVCGKFDMTKRGHILFMATGVVFMVLLVTMIVGFFFVSKWWYLAISVVLALLFSAHLVYDIQMVMGGKRYAISPDEYIFASVQIYLDIINIFLAILNIVGIAQS